MKMFLLRHPVEICGPEANAFSAHLATREQVSASTHDQALSASLFLYRRVLRKEIGEFGATARAKRPRRFPVVLTPKVIKLVLTHLSCSTWLIASLLD